MFKINRADGMALYKKYQKKGLITCVRGEDHNPISFYTKNLAFVGDGTTFVVKSKYGADKNQLISLERYIRNKMPNAFSA